MKRAFSSSLLILFLFSLTGCSFLDTGIDNRAYNELVTINGKITLSPPATKPIAVVLFNIDTPATPRLINFRDLEGSGTFSFKAHPGHYRIFAYTHNKEERKYKPGERIAHSRQIVLQKGGDVAEVNIVIPGEPPSETVNTAQAIRSSMITDLANARKYSGKVVRLDDSIFNSKNIEMGLWEPFRFSQEVPFGVFFLEKFSSSKVPVLYVHGISGSPVNFRELIANLDTTRYQPWIFYYPSGFRLETIVQYMDEVLGTLYAKHHFKHLIIIAHSMGGLVSRSFINRTQGSKRPYNIDLFISISTPWSGHKAADIGVKYAPEVIPVWNDMATESEFIRTLFDIPLPSGMPYYLLFGFKGDSMFSGGNNDGVVSLESVLRMVAQEEAALVRGFNSTHMGILKEKELLTLVNKILATNQEQ